MAGAVLLQCGEEDSPEADRLARLAQGRYPAALLSVYRLMQWCGVHSASGVLPVDFNFEKRTGWPDGVSELTGMLKEAGYLAEGANGWLLVKWEREQADYVKNPKKFKDLGAAGGKKKAENQAATLFEVSASGASSDASSNKPINQGINKPVPVKAGDFKKGSGGVGAVSVGAVLEADVQWQVFAKLVRGCGWSEADAQELTVALRSDLPSGPNDVQGYRALAAARYAVSAAGMASGIQTPVGYVRTAAKRDNTPDWAVAEAKGLLLANLG